MSNLLTGYSKVFDFLNLTRDHSLIYWGLIELGKATYVDIAKKTDIPRSSCYIYVHDLISSGLATEIIEKTKKYILPESPEKILMLLDDRKIKLNNSIKQYKSDLSNLLLQYNAIADKPSVKFYKGIEGIKTILFETLTENDEILVLCQGDEPHMVEKEDPDYILEYIKEFKKRKCKSREIIETRGRSRKYQKEFNDENQKIILAPHIEREDTTHIDKIIYGNKVAIIEYTRERAILIDDYYISLNEKISFNVLWNALIKRNYKY